MSEISVIVTVYNQSVDLISTTIASIIAQQNCDFDIVVADDHSTIDITSQIDHLFADLGFDRYSIVRHEHNLKTVLNLYEALKYAKGTYVKVVAPGDLLYDFRTLRHIVDFMEEQKVDIGFGRVFLFQETPKGRIYRAFRAPGNPSDYSNHMGASRASVLKHQLDTCDWVAGGAQFYKREAFSHFLEVLSKSYGVKYVEDLSATVALLDRDVAYLDEPVLWYEFGPGISTSGKGKAHLYADYSNGIEGIARDNRYGQSYRFARTMYALRTAVALKTPFYGILQKALARFYQRGSDGIVPSDLFNLIMNERN